MRLVLSLLLLTTGCAAAGASDGRPQVLAAAYPFAWAAQQVAGPDAHVVSLVRAGGEPHDVELTPRQVGAVEKASLVVYLHGFQPAVDDAARNSRPSARLDLTPHVDVRPLASDLEDETGSGTDPHVWLDPVRMGEVVGAVAARLEVLDPRSAGRYAARAAAAQGRLRELDALFRTTLTGCARTDLVTAHTAFGYLASRYGLRQVGVTGLAPDNEPSPRHLAEVARYARRHDVRTVYFESRVDPKLAETVAREVGARTAVLDPVEGVDSGDDYLSVMRRNAAALAQGLGCR